MLEKKILFGNDARQKLLLGADLLADSVQATMGAKGRTIMIDKGEHSNPIITKDGVSVANEVSSSDKFQNLGIKVLKQAANLTNEQTGDGTTTTTVIARALLKQGIKHITAGTDPVSLKRGMDKATIDIIEQLKLRSIEVKTGDIRSIATISANGDEQIGTLISDVINKVGIDGVVRVETSTTMKDEIEVVDGLQLQRGYLSPYFITNSEQGVVELISPYILMVDDKITHINDIMPVLEKIAAKGVPLLIIAEDFDEECLATIIANKIRGAINITSIKIPGFGDRKTNILQDVAILTGGVVCSPESGYSPLNVSLEQLGRCGKIIIDSKTSTLFEGNSDKASLEERITNVKNELKKVEANKDKYAIEKLKERLANLTGGIGIIKVFALSEIELKEKKDRVEDALGASTAAIQEGIVIGGGSIFLKISKNIKENMNETLNNDELTGYKLVCDAICAPFHAILKNAGINSDYYSGVLDSLDNTGVDVNTGKAVNMFEAGIIDPTKVERVALQNAVSTISTLLTTEAIISFQEV